MSLGQIFNGPDEGHTIQLPQTLKNTAKITFTLKYVPLAILQLLCKNLGEGTFRR